jgi:hypothetical protein
MQNASRRKGNHFWNGFALSPIEALFPRASFRLALPGDDSVSLQLEFDEFEARRTGVLDAAR